MSEDLRELRNRIDALDRQIVELLNVRAAVSVQVGKRKGDTKRAVFDATRERRVIQQALDANQGPLTDDMLRDIYASILAASRCLQRTLRIAYFGPAASFTHAAARKKFGAVAEYLPARSIDEVFVLTEKGDADYGVVPVENSTEGVVTQTLDKFMQSELKICDELSMPIAHYLLSKGPREAIRRVYSHPQGLGQTRQWLNANLPGVELVEAPNTARAAQIAAGEPGAASVSPLLAAEVYGLDVVASHIEDMTTNVTRFVVLGHETAGPSGHDRTALMFCLQDRVGALHDALALLKRHGINLSLIQSRPSRTQLWDWVFFVEFRGHPRDEEAGQMLEDLRRQCAFMKVLGAWPVDPGS